MERWYRLAVVVLAGLLIPLSPGVAYAAPGNDGDPLSGVPDLIAGATYGTRTVDDESTSPNGQDSGYDATCGAGGAPTEGASVHKITAPAGTKVSLSVSDDQAGQSLCAVELFRSTATAGTLTSIYADPATRAPFRVAYTECPLTSSSCSMNWTLPASGVEYYLVFWPAGDADPPSATYDFFAAVRMPTATALSLSGHYARAGSCYLVRTTGRLTATAALSPTTGTGGATFRLAKRDASGVYRWVSASDVALSSGRASRVFTGLSHGRYNLRAIYGGDETHAPSASSGRCIDVVATSRIKQVLTGWGGHYADYFVYRSGRTITVTATITPAPVSGTVRFRLDREIGVATYRPWAVYSRAVRSNGVAVFKFSLPYRPSGLPFYRIRSEYLGDRWHRPVTSAWNCIQINR